MAKKIVKKVAEPVTEVVKEDNKVVRVVKEEVTPKIPTIFDKYRRHVETAKDGYLRDLKYPEAMEILRYIQDKTGHKLGLSMSCASCMLSLIETFANLEK